MKNQAMCFLLCAVSMGATAASKVEMYGVVDIGVAKGNGGASSNPGGNGANSAWQMKQASASRIGFRGAEDLGSGWSTGFLLEHRFQPDTGTAGTPFFMQSTLSLGHKALGSFWMGRDYAPFFWVALKADPFNMDGVGQMGPAQYNDFKSNGDNTSRTSNTLGFKSRRFQGLSVDAAYALRENGGNSQVGFNLQYQGPRIYAAVGYAKVQQAVAANALTNDALINAALVYSADKWRAMGYVSQAKNKVFATQSLQYTLAMDARLGAGRLKAAFTQIHSDVDRLDRKKLGVGYDYPLSKLTRAYVDVGHARQRNLPSNTAVGIGMRKAF